MPRGIAWDDLPNPWIKKETVDKQKAPELVVEEEPLERNYVKDANAIGKHILFGSIVSFL